MTGAKGSKGFAHHSGGFGLSRCIYVICRFAKVDPDLPRLVVPICPAAQANVEFESSRGAAPPCALQARIQLAGGHALSVRTMGASLVHTPGPKCALILFYKEALRWPSTAAGAVFCDSRLPPLFYLGHGRPRFGARNRQCGSIQSRLSQLIADSGLAFFTLDWETRVPP
jgi:hypothetical protein